MTKAARRIFPDEIECQFPQALERLMMTKDEIEASDLEFYVYDGVLYSQSHDEQNAFRFNSPLEWEEMDTFPLVFLANE